MVRKRYRSFGSQEQIRSPHLIVKENRFGSSVFIIEYRVMKGEHSDPKQRKEKGIERRANKYQVGKLLQDIHSPRAVGWLARGRDTGRRLPRSQSSGLKSRGTTANHHLGLRNGRLLGP